MIAVLISGGVLFGASAVVVDIGQVYSEREQLQSGADAAALSAVAACVNGEADECVGPLFMTPARVAARAAADDGAMDASLACGRVAGAQLGACAPGQTNLAKCVGDRPATGNYIEVKTTTRTKDNATLLPPTFAQTLAGQKKGVTVAACSRASWGTALRVPKVFPLMISRCAWKHYTARGTQLGPKPIPPMVPSFGEVTIDKSVPNCGPGPAQPGEAAEKGFEAMAMLIGEGAVSCSQDVQIGDWMAGLSGSNLLESVIGTLASIVCQASNLLSWFTNTLAQALQNGKTKAKTVYLPVYDDVQTESWFGITTSRKYHIVGMAPFVPTGSQVGLMLPEASWYSSSFCRSILGIPIWPNLTNPCFQGFFVKDTIQGPFAGNSSNDFGLSGVQLAG